MNRRTFLKIIGLSAAIAAMPSSLKAVGNLFLQETQDENDAYVREVFGYDAMWDNEFVRYDVYNGKERLHVSWKIGIEESEELKTSQRKIGMKILINEMNKRNWKLSDLRPLPLGKMSGNPGKYISMRDMV